jgi:diguanylate cyclase (GGDEF)-like protein
MSAAAPRGTWHAGCHPLVSPMQLTTRPGRRGRRDLAVADYIQVTWPLALIVGSLALIFELDRTTGSAPVQHLYYFPIVVAGASFGLTGGLLAALAAVVLYHSTNPQLLTFHYEHWDVLQIAVFVAVGLITAKLTGDARRLHRLAMTDDLTGLHNLRSFEQKLEAMVRTSRDGRTPLSLLVIDLDRLKTLNDVHGHLAGAEAVRTVGHLIGAWTPPDGVACRYGGDEFVVAIPNCTSTQAIALADRLRQQVNDTAPVLAGIEFPATTLSVSVGVATRPVDQTELDSANDSGEALFRLADAALYSAKQDGRNHVHLA